MRGVPEGLCADALVRSVISGLWTGRFSPGELTDDAPLGEDGLGLDSIEIAELVVACEDASGILLDEEIFSQEPLTIRRVIDHFSGHEAVPAT